MRRRQQTARPVSSGRAEARTRAAVLACVLLATLCVATFWGVASCGFTNYDDEQYITKNPHIQRGISLATIKWSFTTGYAANWHPLTWLSHSLDWRLFGPRPTGHHVTSLALHIANTLLLFLLLFRLSGSIGRSATVAALFACHPLHVESVAWLAERKDVLSTLFWLLATGAYVSYVRRPARARYILVVALFALGLMAKPMLVTLPFTLLLLDYWPLSRWPARDAAADQEHRLALLVGEKAPLFALSAASSVVTFLVQSAGRSVGSLETYTLWARVGNAVVAYGAYLWKALWPSGLAVFYPHPRAGLPWWQIAAAVLFMGCATAVAVHYRRSRPYVLVGWLWYVGTLVPVIGLVQVGSQAMADRYTYIPLIGIFVAVTWAAADLSRSVGRGDRPTFAKASGQNRDPAWIGCVATLVVLALAGVARAQVAHWRNTAALFKHTIAVTKDNAVAHINLGAHLMESGRLPEAIYELNRALSIAPDNSEAHISLGRALGEQGNFDGAIRHLARALEIDPLAARAHANFGIALASRGRRQEAIAHFSEAVRLDPDSAESHNNLGLALAEEGRLKEALEEFDAALSIDQGFAKAHANLALVFARMGDRARARQEAELARSHGLDLPPDFWQSLADGRTRSPAPD